MTLKERLDETPDIQRGKASENPANEKTKEEQMADAKVFVSMDQGSAEEVKKAIAELTSAIEKANSLADELARKVWELKLRFKVGSV